MVNTAVLQKATLGLHIFQAFWSIVVMGVIVTGMVQEGPASGAAKFMFGMCWLNLPCIIYLTMSPRFERTKMFAHPYWVIGMNTLFSILWFAAFVSVSSYTNRGISKGETLEKDKKLKDQGGCAVFHAGTGETEKTCKMNQSAVGLGVIMWFFWLATAGIAGYAAWYYSKHSISPFEDFSTPSNEIQETTKDAFSSNDEYAPINRSAHPHEDYDEEDIESRARHGRSPSAASSAYNSTYSRGEDPAHPGTPLSWAAERQPYVGIGGHAPIAPHGDATMPTVEDYSYGGARI